MRKSVEAELDGELSKKVVGMAMTEDTLDQVNDMVIDHLVDTNTHI